MTLLTAGLLSLVIQKAWSASDTLARTILKGTSQCSPGTSKEKASRKSMTYLLMENRYKTSAI